MGYSEDMQKDGPWLLQSEDGSLRSIDPASLPDPLHGKVIQVLYDRGDKRLSIHQAKAIVVKAARWEALSNEGRRALLIEDSYTYADLARAATRIEVIHG